MWESGNSGQSRERGEPSQENPNHVPAVHVDEGGPPRQTVARSSPGPHVVLDTEMDVDHLWEFDPVIGLLKVNRFHSLVAHCTDNGGPNAVTTLVTQTYIWALRITHQGRLSDPESRQMADEMLFFMVYAITGKIPEAKSGQLARFAS